MGGRLHDRDLRQLQCFDGKGEEQEDVQHLVHRGGGVEERPGAELPGVPSQRQGQDILFRHGAEPLPLTLNRFGGFANAAGESGVAPLKSLGLPAAALTFNTTAQTYLETEGIIAKLTDENWTVNFADSM